MWLYGNLAQDFNKTVENRARGGNVLVKIEILL